MIGKGDQPGVRGTVTRSRFAPSPTGYLHLGHIAHALYVWGLARVWGAKLIFRVEDHDTTRCRPEFEAAILEDMAWLGLDVDEPELTAFAAGPSPYRQSDCGEAYQAALAVLQAQGRVYACECSRREILTRTGPQEGELCYDGHCRTRGLAWTPERGLRMLLDAREVVFRDLLLNAPAKDWAERSEAAEQQRQIPAEQCGDLLLRDRHGNWSYQFAVVVDDLRHEIDLIIRGEDLLQSTGRQILLAELLGRPRPPAFAHHPLITGADGRKLSKRDFAGAVRDLRRHGCRPEMVLGLAAYEVGVLPSVRPLHASDLPNLFM